jgi:hypothetical protein
MSTSSSHDPLDPRQTADEADLAEQRTPGGEDDADADVRAGDEADEGDLIEQAMPVPDSDEDDYRD